MSSTSNQPDWLTSLHKTPAKRLKPCSIPDPPGYTATSTSRKPGSASSSKDKTLLRKPITTEETDTLKIKKAWEAAIAPAKSLPMNAIGLYMSGNSLQVFSLTMVFMLFKGPISAFFAINSTFARFETEGTRDKLLLAKLAFVASNLLVLGVGLYKVNSMGLLPTTHSDWLAWEPMRVSLEQTTSVVS